MFLLFDIGGTTTRMAVSHTGDTIDDVKLFPTNHNFSEAMAEMKRVSEELGKGEKFHAVVGGVRAYNRKTGTLFNQPNFPMWVDEPLLSEMKNMWGDVYLENDAVMVGLGEAVFGAGKDHGIVAYVTLSTGVGGCRITRGRVDPTEYSFEPGNMIISDNRGGKNYLEDLVSGSAIERLYGTGPFELADEASWSEIEAIVAMGLNNAIVMWGPEIVVLGGSVPQKLNFENINLKVKELCKIYPEVPPVVLAKIDEQGGLYGGLAYLKNLP